MQGNMLTSTHAQSLALKAKLFRGFADPSRLAIVEALRRGSRSVSEIVEITGLTQPNTSNHLACLLDCGLVERGQQGLQAQQATHRGVVEVAHQELQESAEAPGRSRAHSGRRAARASCSGCSS